MGDAASGAIDGRYFVLYRNTSRPAVPLRTSTVLLTRDYTTFESIRQIIAMREGTSADMIDVASATKVTADGANVDRENHAKSTAVVFGTDNHEVTVHATEDDVATISIGGRLVVGVSLTTGDVGVWPDGDEWVSVYRDPGHPYPQQGPVYGVEAANRVEAARVAYVQALRAAGQTDMSDIIDGGKR